MSEKTHNFLVLDAGETGATLTLAQVKVTKGRTREAIKRFRRQCEDRGMWFAPVHPVAASILRNVLGETIEPDFKKGVNAAGAAEACRTEFS